MRILILLFLTVNLFAYEAPYKFLKNDDDAKLKFKLNESIQDLYDKKIDRSFYIRPDITVADKTTADLTKDGLWHEWDLGGMIPIGVKAVIVKYSILTNVAARASFRKGGATSTNINVSTVVHPGNAVTSSVFEGQLIVECSTNRKIEYKLDGVTWTTCTLIIQGWFF